jgi:ubiquinone/menaquinone biosynthesis C-methylase UbiE
MNYIDKILNKLKKKKTAQRLSSTEAYKLWSSFYDKQPDNVVLFLEEKLFREMISSMTIKDKVILDIGCGTGRHWRELLNLNPARLKGIDSSKEMLGKLKSKFQDAEVFVSQNNSLENFEDSSFDLIISTLTIGHIKEIEVFFKEWNRVLRTNGEILITDFHPDAFASGMKRTFVFEENLIEVENYLHAIGFLKNIFIKLNWEIISIQESVIDDEVRHLFEKQNYLDAYNKHKGKPLILGFKLIKK